MVFKIGCSGLEEENQPKWLIFFLNGTQLHSIIVNGSSIAKPADRKIEQYGLTVGFANTTWTTVQTLKN